jgi:hypothetical protein
MVLKGFTETLAPLEILKWEGITNKQIVTYYDDLNESLPGISHITVFMSRIKLIKQRLVDNPEVAGRRNLQGDEYPVLLESGRMVVFQHLQKDLQHTTTTRVSATDGPIEILNTEIQNSGMQFRMFWSVDIWRV